MLKQSENKFVLCIKNNDCEDLELRKAYRVITDRKASREGYIRIIDESGEDYLYPESYFIPVIIPTEALDALLLAQ
jgi:hypothetical protein